MHGLKFRRQHPIGPYFADFACASKKLAIEIDGEHHAGRAEADARRTKALERSGWKVVRFSAAEVTRNPEGMWRAIELIVAPSPRLSP